MRQAKIKIETTAQPHGFRSWIAFKLVDLAKWIRPGNEAAMTFMIELIQESMMEEMKYGRSEIEVKVKKHKKESY